MEYRKDVLPIVIDVKKEGLEIGLWQSFGQ